MDAPLSAFDKTRIRAVCEELPCVAGQVVIFIKDTDGDLAEEHVGRKVGKRYTFDKIKCGNREPVRMITNENLRRLGTIRPGRLPRKLPRRSWTWLEATRL